MKLTIVIISCARAVALGYLSKLSNIFNDTSWLTIKSVAIRSTNRDKSFFGKKFNFYSPSGLKI